uniref:Uncharacterized protein n=1 Tax=Anguilla anguilla TaxID=7936 RepID=A0A0E9VIS6_ANGAN
MRPESNSCNPCVVPCAFAKSRLRLLHERKVGSVVSN